MARSRQGNRGARGGRGASSGLGSQEALIYLATAATLVVAAGVIIAGLYITRFRPPRVHVLTVQDERFNASDVVDRGAYFVTYQSSSSSPDRFAQDTLDLLVKEAIYRQRGPALVGEVTDADVENEVRLQLGFPSLEPPVADTPADAGATPGASPAATGTAAATATATAAPTDPATAAATATATPDDRAQFAKAYQDFLRRTRLSRDEFELIVRADVIETRLQEQFRAAIGTSGPQLRLSRIEVTDPAVADKVHQQLVDGGDFAALHGEYSTGDEEGDDGDLGWAAIDALPDATAAAVRDLKPGQFSDVVLSGLKYDIFLVTEVSQDQPYDEDTKQALVDRQVEQWLAVEEARVALKRDLSDGAATWINDHILTRARAILAEASG